MLRIFAGYRTHIHTHGKTHCKKNQKKPSRIEAAKLGTRGKNT
nr:MAG TPA: hypothetical protein [Caudoviricetes sp.]